jgi:hypothetical protein
LGQSELDALLDRDDLRQFKQRVALRVVIDPLTAQEIPEYIQHRWTKAGGSEAPFSTDAFAVIGRVSQGVPRVINVICDHALMHACGDESTSVEERHVLGACHDMRLIHPAALAPAQRGLRRTQLKDQRRQYPEEAANRSIGETSSGERIRLKLKALKEEILARNERSAERAPAEGPPPVPAAMARSLETCPTAILERYGAAARPSLTTRLAGRLGSAQRTEKA